MKFDPQTEAIERRLAEECTEEAVTVLRPILDRFETRHVVLALAHIVGQITAIQPDPMFSLAGFQKLVENQTRKAIEQNKGNSDG